MSKHLRKSRGRTNIIINQDLNSQARAQHQQKTANSKITITKITKISNIKSTTETPEIRVIDSLIVNLKKLFDTSTTTNTKTISNPNSFNSNYKE
mmetsp:Transcript_32767/g.29640  ORF Transcript_32767/g.29640 Transcript_32767/m.29640 type:complete len:95 (+) Transcript_32767:427-711(+)